MAYYDPAFPDSVEDFYIGVAADMVQRFAPVPDPVPTDYEDKAARAERLLYEYLLNTQGGALSSVSAAAGSLSFTDLSPTKAIIRSSMGSYYKADRIRVRTTERA